jgi:hypothetical protein
MRAPFADWRPVRNFTAGGVNRPPRGMVLHTAVGSYEGTIAWCNNPASNVSCYFVCGKDGRIAQLVDLNNRAWTQGSGNIDWIGVEFEGYGDHGEALTDAQVTSAATILAWLHQTYNVPLAQADDSRNGRGLIYHGAGGAAWGGHYGCPGPQIVAQRGEIIKRAAAKLGQVPPPLPPSAPKDAVFSTLYKAAHDLSRTFVNGPILVKGTKGHDVRNLQFALIAGAAQQIKVDGDFGPATETAVKNVQRFFHIKVDGIVGPQTRSVLAHVLAVRYP